MAAQGDLAAARARVQDLAELRARQRADPDNPRWWGYLAVRLALLGEKTEAVAAARNAIALRPQDNAVRAAGDAPAFATVLAFVYAWTGDKDQAISEYARLLKTPFSGLNVHEMKRHPRYFPLRGDPRFEALLNDPKNNAPLF